MDREKLEIELKNGFKMRCSEKGYPLIEICLEEAYPGDVSTSYILNIEADWIKNMDCSIALDILIDVLWETTDVILRESIFSINVFNENILHCQSIDDLGGYSKNRNLEMS